MDSWITRRAQQNDLNSLMKLYLHLNPNRPELPVEKAQEIWSDLLSSRWYAVFVRVAAEAETEMAASCVLAAVPNLMRGGRPHAVIENVVTHEGYRRQGHGRAVIQAALDAAWEIDCHHVMLLTGRGAEVMTFYQSCGFEAGIKAGLVARNPKG